MTSNPHPEGGSCGRWPDDLDLAVVLGGGNALGAYHLGVCEELLAGGLDGDPAGQVQPSWYVGASIGAVTAAILVGNPATTRLDRLREFWQDVAQPGSPWLPFLPANVRAYWSNGFGLGAALTGRPGLATMRMPGLWSLLPGMLPDQAVQDLAPLRRTLERLVDFGRLNAAPERLSILAIDLNTAEEVWFDNREGGIGPDHILASASLTPLFPPVVIDGRQLCDAGLRNNLPIERVFSEPRHRPLLCVASDLYGLGGVQPASLDRAVTRAQDLGFAAQAQRGIEGLARERSLLRQLDPRSPAAVLAHLAYDAPSHQRSLKALDFSSASLTERAQQGRADVVTLRSALRDVSWDQALSVVRLPRSALVSYGEF